MKRQTSVAVALILLTAGVMVWLDLTMAPEPTASLNETATTSVNEMSEIENLSPRNEAEVVPSPSGVLDNDTTMCTMDAKLCPDGSYVGRTGPDCAFAACPNDPPVQPKTVTCTPEMSAADVCPTIYAPVCGLVEIQCITTPCNPIPETFSNGCTACARGNVISYTEGACRTE